MSSKKTVFWLTFYPRIGGKHIERALFFDYDFAMYYADELARARGSYDSLVIHRREPSGEIFAQQVTVSGCWRKLTSKKKQAAEHDLNIIRSCYSAEKVEL